jgi:hypothetical protein
MYKYIICVVVTNLIAINTNCLVSANPVITKDQARVNIRLDSVQFGENHNTINKTSYRQEYKNNTITELYSLTNTLEKIPHGQKYTEFSLVVSSKVNGIVSVKFNDPNIVLQRPQDQYEISQGSSLNLRFTAYEATSGIVQYFNDKAELIHEEVYTINYDDGITNNLSLGGGVQQRGYGDNESLEPSIKIDYRRTKRNPYESNKKTSWGITIDNSSRSTNGHNDSFNPNARINYDISW